MNSNLSSNLIDSMSLEEWACDSRTRLDEGMQIVSRGPERRGL